MEQVFGEKHKPEEFVENWEEKPKDLEKKTSKCLIFFSFNYHFCRELWQ